MMHADQRCPSCGEELPPDIGQHALAPSAGVVQCPSCGATVTLRKAGARNPDDEVTTPGVPRAVRAVGGEEGAPESFSGRETVEGVMEELEEKPGGPRRDQ